MLIAYSVSNQSFVNHFGEENMKLKLLLVSILLLVGMVSFASAAPISLGDALSGTGDGLNSRWVNVTYSPQNVDQAISGLNLSTSSPYYVSEVN